MKRNKYLALLLVFGTSMALTSCGGNTPSNDSSSAPASSASSVAPASSSESSAAASSSKESSAPVSSSESSAPVSSSESSAPASSSEESSAPVSSSESSAPVSSSEESSSIVSSSESSAPVSSSSESSAPVIVEYDINVVEDEAVSVSVAKKAQAGEVVRVKLTYSSEAIVIDRVLAGDQVCGVEADGYYFVMPEEAVSISVVRHEIAEVVTANIKNGAVDTCDLIGLGETAVVGSLVSFKIGLKAGYVFSGVENVKVYTDLLAFDIVEVPVTHETDEEGHIVFSFVMPEGDVKVAVGTTRGFFKLNTDDENDLIYSIRSKYGDESYSRVNYDAVQFANTVSVTLRNTSKIKVTGIVIVETKQELLIPEEQLGTNDMTVQFTMPAKNITIKPIFEDLVHEIAVVNSEHLSVELFKKNAEGEMVAVTGGVAEETVYAKVTGETEDIKVKKIVFNYYVPSSWGSPYSRALDITSSLVDGYYSFTMPVPANENNNITVTENNVAAYRGYSFVGDFIGAEIYSYNSGQSFNSNYGVSINGAGDVIKGPTTSYPSNYSITSVDGTKQEGVMTIDSSKSMAYSDKVVFSSYSISNLTSADNLIAVKKENSSDLDSDYSMKQETFGSYGNYYSAVQFFKKNAEGVSEFYAGAFVAENTKPIDGKRYFISDVSFEMTSGEYVNDTTAAYNVKVGEKTIASVSYSGTGGKSNRFVVTLDGLQGTYVDTADAESSLVLDGSGKATYLGKTFAYVADGNTLTLTDHGDNYVLTLGEGNTFTVVSSHIHENDFEGYKFSGKFLDNYGDEEPFELDFISATKVKFKIATASVTFIPTTSWTSEMIEGQTYSIAENVLTVNTFARDLSDSAPVPTTITFDISEDKNTLSCTSNYESLYTTANTGVLTRVL